MRDGVAFEEPRLGVDLVTGLEGQRETLEKLVVSRTAPVREVQRARALLLAADGWANVAIAAAVARRR